MNNIYKVIWSKAKNCYVVASEIAKSHTKSASGSEKMGGYGKKALLALAAASAIFCGGLVNVGAADTVHVDESSTPATAQEVYTKAAVDTALDKKADKGSVYTKADTYTKTEVDTELAKKADASNVFTKDQTFTKDQVNTKLADYAKTTDVNTALAGKANVGDSYTKAEADGKFATSTALDTAKTELDGKIAANTTKITANEKAINDLNTKAATTETTLTDLSGRMAAAESDIDGLQADMATAKSDINSLKTKDTELSGKIDAEINNRITSDTALDKKIDKEIANRITSDTALDKKIDKEIQDRKDAIGTIAENKNYIEKDKNVSDNLVELDKQAKTNADAITETNQRTAGITRDDTKKETSIEGRVTVDTNGNIKAEGTITSNGLDARAGEIKTDGKVSAGDVSTGTLETTGNATIGRDLTVKGILNTKDVTAETIHVSKSEDTVDYKSEGSIIGEGGNLSVSNKKTDKITNITEESQLHVNEKGTVNWATSTDNATGNVTEGRSEVTADNIKNSVKKTEGGKTFGYEENITADGKVGTVTDKEGNTSTTRQDSKGIYGYAKDKDGNKSYTKQEGNRIAESVIGQDGKQTKSEMTSTDITNTAKDGTITNTAQNVTNEGTESVTNKVGNNEVKVSQNGVDIKAEDGKKITESVGTASRVVENDKITDEAGDSTVTTENGKGTTFGKEGSTGTTNIYEDSIKTGTINAEDTTTGKLTAGAAAGVDGGRLTVDAKDGVKGSYKFGDYTSRSYILANTLKSGVDNGKEPIDADFVGSRTDHYMVGDKAKLDETVKDAAGSNVTNKTSTDTVTTITDGITTTKTEQGVKDITNTATDGTIKNEAKVITNKASEVINNEAININNTATGIITSKASEIKNQADKLISNKVGENTWENMEDGKITTSIKNGTKQNLTQSDAEKTEHSVVNGSNSTVNKQTSKEITDAVTNGTTTNVTQNTATSSNNTIADKNGNANTVISTVDGTSFNNSKAAAPVTGASGAGTAVNTNIKGNTITTGKVTMDYAEVMKDLGVHGSAKVDNNLEVGGTSTLTGDVTMGSNANVKGNFNVEGNTNLKDTNVGGKLDVTGKATFSDDVDIKKNLSVVGDVTANSYKVGDKTYIDKNGIHANGQKITDVADGSISEGSKDAVNGGQLYNVKNDLEGKVNKVGANAAAMANLHPMEFDPDSKWNIAAAIGNYGSETAAALGAFYRPNDDVMVNLSTAFGTGENMVGGGVSVRLGKGGNKLSREESNALKDQVNDLTARMDALLSVLNPNMSKDFPDVPENHWAYEAVSRLAGNDIVQGYPDGEFHGERTMTRYEMAEIIYNALSRGAEAEKELVEEFKPELQAMAASEKATAERAEG
uniref:ESPR-type extended signal peptide-containing protein n=1 Tax=Dialister sp. TaxID=1955814 RepID=UPI004026C33E